MIGLIIAIGILVVLLIVVLCLYIAHVQQIKKLNQQFKTYDFCQTNQKLTCESDDKQLVELVNNFNKTVVDTQRLKQELASIEKKLITTITNISHDLRTPLTSMLGYVNLLQKEIENPSEKTEKYFSIVNNRIETIQTLVNQLFEYSLTYENNEELELEKTNVNTILEDIILSFYNDLNDKGINTTINLDESPIICDINKVAIKRVFLNIMGNALKYASSKLTVEQDGNKLLFKNDTTEIDTIDTEKLFDRFFTVGKARNNSSMGLGLTISKLLMEKMNKKMTAYIENKMLVICLDLSNNI